ncbi:serine/threonine-protein kinase HipA [Enterobacter sp. BIGb0383]|uniref:type II toxin-antitoxin system HipA family toxin n=1 Tax=unclassified Enterobacter TaxID=2608935 RepID=UPI000FAD77B5|nr:MULTISPECIES: type II toxin-antitoxin system HipA family toxin [unclassified Enterobacter]ROP60200.1 serine/threonine-protein kinase HipA [Enterobacter sp. BIGb0383]ROS08333.1 serine/threonine-protein kinase HipA [Enterobacter sp. BIGb0359]
MIAQVYLWNRFVGALNWDDTLKVGQFQYAPEFVDGGLQIAPVRMPLSKDRIYSFAALSVDTFKKLPPVFADSLPDAYGYALMDAWLAQNGRDKASFSPVERLLYQGNRGMGALEYRPAIEPASSKTEKIQLDALVELAELVLHSREAMVDRIESQDPSVDDEALKRLIQVGTSAGGARAKAVIAINDKNEIRSGQVKAPKGFSYWLLKFDVQKEAAELADTQGYGRIEYAYYLMAQAAKIEMTECRLLEEGSRAHFMTKRFDRTDDGEKIHMATLCALDHADFNVPGVYSYELALNVMRELNLSREDAIQFFRRMVFNVVARNQDDHTKNIGFLMDMDGTWFLSPAYDVSWAYRTDSEWVSHHQMTINGKRDDFARDDLITIGKKIQGLPLKGIKAIIDDICGVVSRWEEFATEAGVDEKRVSEIAKTHRLYLGDER